jgi:short-subunit dehydrogenase
MSFQDKIAVVTGGSDGIGKALVHALLSAGARVATCGRNYDKLYQLKTSHPNNDLFIHTADVSREEDCRGFIDKVVAHYGRIDILINNAGISMRAEVADTDIATIRQVMDINFWGTVYCSKFALPHILAAKGTIVGVSSIAGFRGLPGRSGYSASKAAVNSFLEVLRTELLETGVNVMWVCPGFTTSNIRNVALNKDAKPQGETPMDEGAMMSADECARHILEAIEKRKRTLVLTFTGKRAIFMNRFFPSLADKLVRNFFYKNGKLVK